MKKSLLAALLVSSALFVSSQMETVVWAQTALAAASNPGKSKVRSLHLEGSVRDVLRQALALYGVEAVLVADEGFASRQMRVDADDADLASAGV